MEGKKRFWCLLGLRPKGTAARRRKHFVLSSGVLRDAQNIPSRDSAATVPLLKQHPCVSCAAYARKGRPAFCGPPQNRDFSRKKRFFPPVFSRQAKLPVGNFDAAVFVYALIPRLAGLRLSRPIAARYL